MFTTALHLRLHGKLPEEELYQVVETCHYSTWASREIICTNNYMEASVFEYMILHPSSVKAVPGVSGFVENEL